MGKANKISLIITICLLTIIAISAMFFSVVLAKYVIQKNREKESATPSNFELVMDGEASNLLYVDFSESGETSPEVGTRVVSRTYDFSVKTLNSQVESNYTLSIFLPEKLYEKIVQEDKTQKGIWVNMKVYVVSNKGTDSESLINITNANSARIEESEGSGTWIYEEVLSPGTNPSLAEGQTDYRLEFELMNVSDTTVDVIPYLAVTNIIIKVESSQIV